MDRHVVLDCQEIQPNRFALTLAAAARSRALASGAEPRLDAAGRSVGELALHEIAAGVFREYELAPFLPVAGGRRSLPPPDQGSRLHGSGPARTAAAPGSPRETVH